MEAKVSTNNTLKYVLMGLILLILAVVAVIIYRVFFQFNAQTVKEYAYSEASKYKDKDAAYSIIMDGVEHILGSHNLTQQVLKIASANNSGKEQELVHAAVMQSKALDYL